MIRGYADPAMTPAPISIALIGNFALAGRERLEAGLAVPYEVIPVPDSVPRERLLELIAPAEVIVGTHLSREMAARARGLRLMHTIGAGIDQVDLSALPPGARLANVYHHGVGIAEYILMAMLALPRELVRYETRFRRGDWSGSFWSSRPIPPPRPELKDKTLALLGLGTIGREVAVRAKAFGMRVLGMRRRGAAGPPVAGVDEVHGPEGLEYLLRQADYVVVALPLGPETEGLIGERALGWMKPSAYLVNVGRGPILEEEPLYRALAEKRIAGLACDVWYIYPRPPIGEEPVYPSRFPFHELDNVLMTPHVSGWTEGTMNGRFRAIAENINRLSRGEPLVNQVYPPAGAEQ
jgi:phosphoglycerate dehydrogenase-like enzyme